ncbi:hypothetical protein GCM10017744_104140 [Streptomyces antimycoticus]|uniref:Uncharacterized protein n=1 Tax=Streptomyces antimycoticus TaxID=68175 RepID=A0A4D4KRR3_9ACTN|nr:hypothetical protein [Streptomyces antimycoticus]GDY49137.1 hypothetical protein SANT12839_100190 [Streptomyces antimycoticus]
MPQIRPGRTRTKRTNRREPLLLSKVDPQDFNVREGEVKSIACPDCRTWRRLMGDTTLKIREHCVSDKVAAGENHRRCPGSNQVVVIDIDVRTWQRQTNRLLKDGMWADQRRAAQQFHKPLLPSATPVTKMSPVPVSAQAALSAYRQHFKKCPACTGAHRCGDGAQLAELYERLQRTQPRRDKAREVLARERVRFDRSYIAEGAERTAAVWTEAQEATADPKSLAKRSGTALEEQNNQCKRQPRDVRFA